MSEKIEDRIKKLFDKASKRTEFHESSLKLQFTESLWALMQEDHATKKQMADRLGVSLPYMIRIMGWGENMTFRSMAKIAAKFNCRWELSLHRRKKEIWPNRKLNKLP